MAKTSSFSPILTTITSSVCCHYPRGEPGVETAKIAALLNRRQHIFSGDVIAFLAATGLEAKRTSIHAPWQNGTAERWIGSCRREILNHIIPVNEEHLRRVIREYVRYHQEDRVHDSLNKDTPSGRPIEPRPDTEASLTALPQLGGLHHRYSWRQAA